ncbi:TetR family transcriptional regulator [Glaciihabitans tibetensis]|uniref:TetR family transcriptional regulator n=1 Tax=Glaciihabitans tibetensis TaxID=1266600 RepID=A0A2T0VIR1_9MICO|nr:TetR/AcrR family transcriptional regulator [Glaciihabitans tibetensis]PRY70120.1 TetR family transcriptional regulator [Glaciihabitans tibetensis]
MPTNEPLTPPSSGRPSGRPSGQSSGQPSGRPSGRPGRRPASSRAAIEDAAGELFLEQSYARTTIEHITTRAGVSRASFFNYFDAKSDLLWGDVDALVDSVEQQLRAQPSNIPPMDAVRGALVSAAEHVGSDRIPLAVTQWELMGARDELLTSGLSRFSRLGSLVRVYLDSRAKSGEQLAVTAASFALVGAVAAAAGVWAAQGTARDPLAPLIDRAIAPVCDGFAPRFS